MKAIALCFKSYLKPEEAMIYCNLERSQFARKCEEFGINKNKSGYYKREDLDEYLGGTLAPLTSAIAKQKKTP